MFTPENEPAQQELDRFLTDEERDTISRADVPDEIRNEIYERLQIRSDRETQGAQAEDFGS